MQIQQGFLTDVNCTVLDLHSLLSQRHFNFRGQLGSCVFCDCQKVTTCFAPTCRVYNIHKWENQPETHGGELAPISEGASLLIFFDIMI